MTSPTDAAPASDPAPAGESHPGGLPVEVTSFIGRRLERTELRRLLGESRLVTLTGFGGIGKSRLALRVAAESQRAFPQGVAYIPLAGISDPELVAPTFIGALGLEGRSTRAAAPALVDYLKGRSMLLVIDNAEHLVDAVALLVDALLRTCPDLRILVTSREPLRIRGEIVHSVQPLSLPARGTTEPLQQFEAAALFLDRARAVHADFEVDASNRDAIVAIVERLEGIPLAMELAAGRLTAMSAVELAESISERWEFVSRGSRAAPDRQQTMTACIEWSFALCTPEEAELWARLSVFGNGFELDAVRGTCAADEEADGRPVEDILLDLVDKSIVIATTTSAGRSRYRMLPPIRSRGIAYLRSHDLLDEARRRHRDWYVGLAVRASQDWMGAGQLAAMQRLRRELGNLQVALEFCTSDPSEVQAGLEIGAHLLEWGLADGLFRDSRMWFNRLLSLDPTPTPTRALALRTAAWFAAMQGDLVGAAELLEDGRSLAERYGEEIRVPLIQATGFVAMFSGELDAAARHFETALEGFRALGDTGQQAHTLALAQLNDVFRGRLDSAIAAHEEVLRLTEPVGELWYRSYSMWIAGLACYVTGDHEAGSRLQRDSLRLKRKTQDLLGIGTSIEALAYDLASSDPMLAAHLMGAAQGIWDRIETSTEALAGLHLLHQQCHRLLHERLSEDEYNAAFGAGRTLNPIAAIDAALDESSTSRPAARARARGRAAPGGQPSTLTRRELQIAELVAQGLSNRDIAAQLVISKRTAETHVEHILTKLGFTNRNQIAAWLRERDRTS